MRSIVRLALLSALSFCGGCTSYWQDRWADAKDPFRVVALEGYGFTAKAGAFESGVASWTSLGGFSQGRVRSAGSEEVDPFYVPLLSGVRGSELEDAEHRARGKWKGGVTTLAFPSCNPFQPASVADNTPPLEAYLDLRAGVALGAGVEVGFHPGEFVDFMLGFVGIDIFGDDLESTMEDRATIRIVDQHGKPFRGIRALIDGRFYRSDEDGRIVTERLSAEIVSAAYAMNSVERGRHDYVVVRQRRERSARPNDARNVPPAVRSDQRPSGRRG